MPLFSHLDDLLPLQQLGLQAPLGRVQVLQPLPLPQLLRVLQPLQEWVRVRGLRPRQSHHLSLWYLPWKVCSIVHIF
jgi:hypothetical protein